MGGISLLLALLALGAGIHLYMGRKTQPRQIHVTSPASQGQSPTASVSSTPSRVPSTANVTVLDTSDWKIYRSDEYGFTLKYPPSYEIIAPIAELDSKYEKTFRFKTASSSALSLLVFDLRYYLPHYTSTSSIASVYLKTFIKNLTDVEEVTIRGKRAYEYLSCGHAACSQEIEFVHDNRTYEFSIHYPAFFPNGEVNGDVDPRSIRFESSPKDIQEIVKSIEFF